MPEVSIEINGRKLNVAKAIDISLPIDFSLPHERAWYIGPSSRKAVVLGDWVGSTEAGGSVNFFNLQLNPHAHGTHIETEWHVHHHRQMYPAMDQWFLNGYLFTAEGKTNEALDLRGLWPVLPKNTEALVIRTLPNPPSKASMQYSQTHHPYLAPADAEKIARQGISVLLIDLPSVDPEQDGGLLAAHKSFWKHQTKNSGQQALIGELLYIPDRIDDGEYAVHIQHPAMINDAVPARIFLIPFL